MATQAQRREQTRQALVDAAEQAFSTHGFHGASLDAIADAAGYSKGAVYGRFSGKDELFLAVMEQRFGRRLERFSDAWQRGERFEDRLVNALREQSHAARGDVAWSAAWLEFVAHATRQPRTLRTLRELDQRLVRSVAARMAQNLGLDRSGNEFMATLSLLIGSGLQVERLLDPEAFTDADAERLARALARELERGAGDD